MDVSEERRFMLRCVYSFIQRYRERAFISSPFKDNLIDSVWVRVQNCSLVILDLEEMSAVVIAIDFCARSMLSEGRWKGFDESEYKFFKEAESLVRGYKIAMN